MPKKFPKSRTANPMNRRVKAFLGAPVLFAIGCAPQPENMAPVQLPEPESAAAQLHKRFCGQCHGAPSPAVHTAAHWPSVLYRMQSRMAQKGMRTLSDDELRALTEYLQKFAKSAP